MTPSDDEALTFIRALLRSAARPDAPDPSDVDPDPDDASDLDQVRAIFGTADKETQ